MESGKDFVEIDSSPGEYVIPLAGGDRWALAGEDIGFDFFETPLDEGEELLSGPQSRSKRREIGFTLPRPGHEFERTLGLFCGFCPVSFERTRADGSSVPSVRIRPRVRVWFVYVELGSVSVSLPRYAGDERESSGGIADGIVDLSESL